MSSNRVRVLIVEAELGEAAVLQDLIGGFLGSNAVVPITQTATEPVLPPVAAPRELPPAPKERKPAKVKRAPGGASHPPAPARTAPAEDGGSRATIIEALKKRPMVSGEIMKVTGLSSSKVYSMLNILRNEGVVESRKDDDSIYPKQYLVKA